MQQKLPFIKTDLKLGPSKRFLIVLNEYFSKKGFVFKKSANMFIRKFDLGKQIIFVHFHSHHLSGLVSANCKIILELDKLENIYSDVLEGKPSHNRYTIAKDLQQFDAYRKMHWKHPSKYKQLGRIDLFDEPENNVPFTDDASLNRAANEYIANYEEFILPFFDTCTQYQELEWLMNGTVPLANNLIFTNRPFNQDALIASKSIPVMPEKWIVQGIILGSVYKRIEVNELIQIFREYINDMEYPQEVKQRFNLLIGRTLDFKESKELDKVFIN